MAIQLLKMILVETRERGDLLVFCPNELAAFYQDLSLLIIEWSVPKIELLFVTETTVHSAQNLLKYTYVKRLGINFFSM